MKTILVPIDYSETSNNALRYALELASFSNAKLILFHAYHIPVPTAEAPVVMIAPEELEKENFISLQKLEKKIRKKHAGVQTELIVRAGFPVDEINSVLKEKEIDLVVMGVTGAGKKSGILFGSNTTSLMKKTKTPVLVVPHLAKFKKPEKIVIAFDYKKSLPADTLQKLKKIIKLFKAKVLILDVVKPEEVPAYEGAVAGIALENSLSDIEHTLYFPNSENISEEINFFADAHLCDWLVMFPHSHKSLSGLFHKSNTKQMAFHTHLPLLSLHD